MEELWTYELREKYEAELEICRREIKQLEQELAEVKEKLNYERTQYIDLE